MPTTRIVCPVCSVVLQFPGVITPARKVRCPKCKSEFLPLPPVADEVTIAAAEPPQPSSEYSYLSPPQSADELGRLGAYRVLRLLGQGGMGAVFLAEDPALQRQIALKVMLPSVANNPTAKARFLREARAVAAVEHDHIIHIHQVGEIDGVPFLTMPLLKGQTLADRLSKELSLADIVRLGREVAEGLSAAHDRGLIHRDIKPANVWLEGSKERVKILDFGLARATGSSEPQLTTEGISSSSHNSKSGAVGFTLLKSLRKSFGGRTIR